VYYIAYLDTNSTHAFADLKSASVLFWITTSVLPIVVEKGSPNTRTFAGVLSAGLSDELLVMGRKW